MVFSFVFVFVFVFVVFIFVFVFIEEGPQEPPVSPESKLSWSTSACQSLDIVHQWTIIEFPFPLRNR